MRKKTLKRSPTGIRTDWKSARPAATGKSKPGFAYALIHHDVCRFFDAIRSACALQEERGGILIGSYRGPHIEITDFTEPGPNDLAALSFFVRVDECHQDAAADAWRRSNGTATYVGEWHSHPFGEAHPSRNDRETWQSVVARLRTPCLFVVVSPSGWQIFRVSRRHPSDIAPLAQIEVGSTGTVFY